MERLAREKIALQQRLSTLKKDMLGKWDHLDWRAMVPEDLDIDLEPDAVITVDYGNGRKSGRKTHSPSEVTQPLKTESETEESNDSHYPISLSMNNGNHGMSINSYFSKGNFFLLCVIFFLKIGFLRRSSMDK
jgi:hypothetical protein